MNKFNLHDHPTLVDSLLILHMENGDCYVNIYCMNGSTYFADSLTYTDKHSAELGGKAEQLPDHIVYFCTINLFLTSV